MRIIENGPVAAGGFGGGAVAGCPDCAFQTTSWRFEGAHGDAAAFDGDCDRGNRAGPESRKRWLEGPIFPERVNRRGGVGIFDVVTFWELVGRPEMRVSFSSGNEAEANGCGRIFNVDAKAEFEHRRGRKDRHRDTGLERAGV